MFTVKLKETVDDNSWLVQVIVIRRDMMQIIFDVDDSDNGDLMEITVVNI